MTYTKAIFLLILLASGAQTARSEDFLVKLQRHDAPVQTVLRAPYAANPAMMQYADSISISDVTACGSLLRRQQAVVVEEGTGHTLGTISANSYMHTGTNSTVWGDARYTTGKVLDIRWCDATDFDRIGPYTLGDSVGGDLQTRQYEFAGGWARAYGRYTVGAHANYRATVGYRSQDPRVKTVVSDLDIALGGSMRLGATYALGVMAGFNVYNQNTDVDYYNPLNDITTYPLTGLGTFYARFKGNANNNTGHSSIGWSAGLQWLPVTKKTGTSVTLTLNGYRMNWMLRNYNNITAAYTDNLSGSLHAGHAFSAGSVLLAPAIDARLFHRDGTENLFGSVTAGSYPLTGSRQMYRRRSYCAALTIPAEWRPSAASILTVGIAGLWQHDTQRYLQPLIKEEVTYAGGALNAAYSLRTGNWLLDAGASALAQTHRNGYNVSLAAARSITRAIALRLALSHSHIHYSRFGNSDGWQLALSANF